MDLKGGEEEMNAKQEQLTAARLAENYKFGKR